MISENEFKINNTMLKIFKKLKSIIFKYYEYNLWQYMPPYDYVQAITVQNVSKYLGLKDISRWCIVGGYLGFEISGIQKHNSNVSIDIFECSHRYVTKLNEKFANFTNISIIEMGVAEKSGTRKFFETNLEGSGSLYKVGSLAMESYGAKLAEQKTISVITLDEYYKNKVPPEVLWIDVQGAELLVLQGASEVLAQVSAIFIEVSVKPDLYVGGAVHVQITNYLEKKEFSLVLLGTDYNLTGNALYIKNKN